MAKTEIGYQASALESWASISLEANESNPDLVWPQSISVYDKMRKEDSQVGSVLRAVTMPIRSTGWSIDPAGADSEVVAFVADQLNLPVRGETPKPALRTSHRFSWVEHLRMALLELVYGHSFFEQVYKIEDGKAQLHKLAWRPPRSISKIDVAADGGLVAIEQYPAAGKRTVRIPVEHLVAYVNDREGANWLGESLLRQAYKNWLLKDRILRAQALTVERNGMGIPVYKGATAPTAFTEEEQVNSWNEQQREEGLKIVKSLRAGATAGASIPHEADLSLMSVQGNLPSTEKPIQYHDEQIARAVLAHFLNLGTKTGSWALGNTFETFFTDSLNAVAQQVTDVTQQHVVEDLVDLNWGPSTPAPRIYFEPIGSKQPATAEAIKALVDAGAISNDPSLETYLRERYGLPARGQGESDSEVQESPPREGLQDG